MSQTDIPGTPQDGDGGQRRAGHRTAGRIARRRRRRDGHSGRRCRMCGQTVVVDRQGRCVLGHQVASPEEVAAWSAEEADWEAPSQEGADGDQGDGGLVLEVDLGADDPGEAGGPAAHLSTPALGLSAASSTLASVGAPPVVEHRWVPGIAIPGARLDTPTTTPVGDAPRVDQAADPAAADPALTAPVAADPPADPAATGQTAADPDVADPDAWRIHDAPLPVDEPLPPLPVGAPRVAAPDVPVAARPRQPDPAARRPGAATPDPDQPPGFDDYTPYAISVLDIGPLPAPAPREEPTFVLEPLEDDDLTAGGPGRTIAAIAFLAVLVGIAVLLATTL